MYRGDGAVCPYVWAHALPILANYTRLELNYMLAAERYRSAMRAAALSLPAPPGPLTAALLFITARSLCVLLPTQRKHLCHLPPLLFSFSMRYLCLPLHGPCRPTFCLLSLHRARLIAATRRTDPQRQNSPPPSFFPCVVTSLMDGACPHASWRLLLTRVTCLWA